MLNIITNYIQLTNMFFLCLLKSSIDLVLSSPKWIFSLLPTNQSLIFASPYGTLFQFLEYPGAEI